MRARVFLLVCVAAFLGGLAAAQSSTEAKREPSPRPRRLYFGAPPTVPHDMGLDMNDCLVCHGDPDMGAPLTPHPTRLRCRQCHLPAAEDVPLFRSNRLAGLPPPGRAPRLQPSGPPLILHPVLLREKCLACHAPEAREDVISTPHPERLRCQQCHIPQRPDTPQFSRPPTL